MNSLGRRSSTMQGSVSSGRSYLSRLLPRPAWLLALTLGLASPASAQAPGTWAPMADLNQPRAEHTATLLASGTVLIAGGRDAAYQPLASAEIYDPATGGYTLLASPLPAPVWGHTAIRLNNGTVLIAGGQRGARYRRAAQLFDPATDTFTALGPMSTPRGRHTATLLRDGRVVVIGGTDGVKPLASLEIYDPTTRTFSLAPSALAVVRQDHTTTLLPDGRILVVGGSNASGALDSAEIYDPTAGTVSPAAPLNVPRTLASAALLLDGTVLVAGGQTTSEDLDSAEVYDAATNTFAWLPAAMGTARSGHLGVQLLHNGKVLISGGTSGGQLVASAEVYDPVTGAFQPVDSPGTARRLFGANFFELPYTGILLATGGLDSAEAPLASSEVFFYPTLRSDKPDYAPGETVTLMGEGWLPNEQVTINIRESSGDPDTNLTATADASGAFTNSEFQTNPDRSDVGVRFLATATGQASNWTAQTTFTDVLRSTSTSVTCTPSTVDIGGSTSCKATVQDTASGNKSSPTGTVSFTSSGTGTFTGSPCTLVVESGNKSSCSVTYSPSAGGTHTITGAYSGSATHASSSGSTDVTAMLRSSGTSVDCVPPSVPVDGSTTCTATVSDTTGTGASTPTGTVSWTSDGAGTFSAASCTLDASGKCTVNYTPTAVGTGTHKITGSYGGDAKHATSTGSFDEAVGRRATATSVSCTPPSVAVDSSTACTATVTNGSGANIPTGTVSWTSDGTGTFSAASCTLDASGKCTVNYTPTAVGTGTHKLTGSYGGDAKHATSTGSFDEAVGRRATATSVSCAPPSVAVDSATACTATVTNGSGANIPTGTVSWTSDGTGNFSAASCTLDATGKCTVNYTPTAVGTGTHKITGSYGGDAKHATSTGSFDDAVGRRATATSVSCTPPSVAVDSSTA